jgi:predicted MFS family arabinose efflux permease
MPLGAGVMILASPALLSFGWRGLWWANALIAALYALALAAATRPAAAEARRPPPRFWRDLRRTAASPGALLLAFAFAAYAANWLAAMGFLPTYLAEQRRLGPEAVAALTALAVFANAGGNLLGGWLLHHGAARWRLMALALVVMALASPAIYAEGAPDGLRYLACLLFSGLSGLLPASVLAAAPRYAPSPSLIGTMNGLLVQGSNLGQLAGPPILAALISRLGWSGSPLFVIAASALGLGAVLWLRRLEAQATAAALPPSRQARHG